MPDLQEIAHDVACLSLGFVNVYFIGGRGQPWVLVDTGIPGSANKIRAAAAMRYGAGVLPEVILLTHGHVDHSGSAKALLKDWDVPTYAHPMEMPYLTDQSAYPPLDPTIGGVYPNLARLFPTGPFDLGPRLQPLPEDGEVPFLPGWQWIYTPGHAPGNVSYFRAEDKVLIAGDAIATEDMDDFPAAARHKQEISIPPSFANYDWKVAQESVQTLAALRPMVIAAGHGTPMSGPDIAPNLQAFADNFPVPSHGRYIHDPARVDKYGVTYLPPPAPDPLLVGLGIGIGLGALAGGLIAIRRRAKEN